MSVVLLAAMCIVPVAAESSDEDQILESASSSVPSDDSSDAESEEEPAFVPTIDGDLSEWGEDGVITVDPDNGYWQAVPTTSDTLMYAYKLATDGTKLYGAIAIDCALVVGGNGAGTNVRLWLRTNNNANVYTHFYDINADTLKAMKNTSTTANSAAAIANSSLTAEVVSEGDVTYMEFSVDLAEFNGTKGFDYFISVSNKVNENVCLFYPVVPAEGAVRTANLPYSKWYANGDITVKIDTADDSSEQPEDSTPNAPVVPGDSSSMIIFAIIALVAIAGSAVVIKTRR